MKLLLDQGIGQPAAAMLADLGHDAVHVGPRGLATSTDEEILGIARSEKRVVVTLDTDFHRLLAMSNEASPSVIRIRFEGLDTAQQVELIDRILADCHELLASGAVVTVLPHEWRSRRLPLDTRR